MPNDANISSATRKAVAKSVPTIPLTDLSHPPKSRKVVRLTIMAEGKKG